MAPPLPGHVPVRLLTQTQFRTQAWSRGRWLRPLPVLSLRDSGLRSGSALRYGSAYDWPRPCYNWQVVMLVSLQVPPPIGSASSAEPHACATAWRQFLSLSCRAPAVSQPMSSACPILWGAECPPFIRGSSGAPPPHLHPGSVPLREVNPSRGRCQGGARGVSLRGRVPPRACPSVRAARHSEEGVGSRPWWSS